MTTIHDLRRRQAVAVKARGGFGLLVPAAAAAAAIVGLTIAYFGGVFARPPARVVELAQVYDQYLDDLRRINDARDVIQSPADLPAQGAAVGAQLEPIAADLDDLAKQVRRLTFDRDDLYRVRAERRDAENREIRRWEEAEDRIRGSVSPGTPLRRPLLHAMAAWDAMPEAMRAVVRDHDPPAAPPPPLPSVIARLKAMPVPSRPTMAKPPLLPTPAARATAAPVPAPGPVASGRPLLFRVRGATLQPGQIMTLAEHVRRLLSARSGEGKPDPAGAADAYLMWVVPDLATTPQAVAAVVDFGRATVDPATRVIVVDADPAKVADVLARMADPSMAPLFFHVRGVTLNRRQGRALVEHLRQRLPAAMGDARPDSAHPGQYLLAVKPGAPTSLAAAAAAVDFGRATVDPATSAILVDADPDRVAAIGRELPPGLAFGPPGTPHRDASEWLPGAGTGPGTTGPYASSAYGPLPSTPFPADQTVTVHLRGLPDRNGQLLPLQTHLLDRVRATLASGHGDAAADPAATVVMAPAADAAAVAAAVDFGRATADPAGRSVTVDVDPVRVGQVIAAAADARRAARPVVPPPPAPPPPVSPSLPAVVAAGTVVQAHRGDDWAAATVLAREGRRYHVHYDGEPDANDAWVGRDQLRPADAR